MSKGLTSYTEERRMDVAMRRTRVPSRGCGYWGAVAYLNKHGIRTKEQSVADAVNAIMEGAAVMDKIMHKEDRHGPKKRKSKYRGAGPPVSSLDDRSKKTLAAFRNG